MCYKVYTNPMETRNRGGHLYQGGLWGGGANLLYRKNKNYPFWKSSKSFNPLWNDINFLSTRPLPTLFVPLYTPIAFDKRVTFWLQRVRSLRVCCII